MTYYCLGALHRPSSSVLHQDCNAKWHLLCYPLNWNKENMLQCFLKPIKLKMYSSYRDLVRTLKNNTASMCQDTKTLAKGCLFWSNTKFQDYSVTKYFLVPPEKKSGFNNASTSHHHSCPILIPTGFQLETCHTHIQRGINNTCYIDSRI